MNPRWRSCTDWTSEGGYSDFLFLQSFTSLYIFVSQPIHLQYMLQLTKTKHADFQSQNISKKPELIHEEMEWCDQVEAKIHMDTDAPCLLWKSSKRPANRKSWQGSKTATNQNPSRMWNIKDEKCPLGTILLRWKNNWYSDQFLGRFKEGTSQQKLKKTQRRQVSKTIKFQNNFKKKHPIQPKVSRNSQYLLKDMIANSVFILLINKRMVYY